MKYKILPLLTILFLAMTIGTAIAGWNCQFEGGKKGTVGKPNSLTIDFGTILWADKSNGESTYVGLPTEFDHYDAGQYKGTWQENQIVTPFGNFIIKVKVKLAGNKSWGFWHSKKNEVTIEVHDGDGAGQILKQKVWSGRVGSPSTKTITLDQVSANLQSGNKKMYTIIIRFHKYDGKSNEGWCGMPIWVGAN